MSQKRTISASSARVIQFPNTIENRVLFEKLDQCIFETLTPLIGFTCGSEPIYNSGIRWIGQLVALSDDDLLSIPHIGKKRLAAIKALLDEWDLALDQPHDDWIKYRTIRPLPGERRPPMSDWLAQQHRDGV